MSAFWIIDGYNVILRLGGSGRLPQGELAERRQVLEERVAHFGRQRGICPLVVYDGRRMSGGHAGASRGDHLDVTFVAPPADADDLIHHRAAGWRQEGREVRVVTSDRELASRVRQEGAVVISTEAFGARLVDLGRKRTAGPHQADDMADIEAHFLALHHEEEQRRAESRPMALVPPARLQEIAVEPAAPVRVNKRRPDTASGMSAESSVSRDERRHKGRLRQQRKLQSQRRSRGVARRRRH